MSSILWLLHVRFTFPVKLETKVNTFHKPNRKIFSWPDWFSHRILWQLHQPLHLFSNPTARPSFDSVASWHPFRRPWLASEQNDVPNMVRQVKCLGWMWEVRDVDHLNAKGISFQTALSSATVIDSAKAERSNQQTLSNFDHKLSPCIQ